MKYNNIFPKKLSKILYNVKKKKKKSLRMSRTLQLSGMIYFPLFRFHRTNIQITVNEIIQIKNSL